MIEGLSKTCLHYPGGFSITPSCHVVHNLLIIQPGTRDGAIYTTSLFLTYRMECRHSPGVFNYRPTSHTQHECITAVYHTRRLSIPLQHLFVCARARQFGGLLWGEACRGEDVYFWQAHFQASSDTFTATDWKIRLFNTMISDIYTHSVRLMFGFDLNEYGMKLFH